MRYRGSGPAPYVWQTSTSPPNPSPQFCRWAVRAWDGPEAVSQNCLSLSEYMSFTYSWHQYHCNVYSPMGRTSRAWVLGVLAIGLLQLLYLSPASSSAFRLLPSSRAQAWFLSQNLKDGGLSIVTLVTLQMTSKLQDHLCPRWWSICFGKRRFCYATQGALNPWSSCLSVLGAGIVMCHHTWPDRQVYKAKERKDPCRIH